MATGRTSPEAGGVCHRLAFTPFPNLLEDESTRDAFDIFQSGGGGCGDDEVPRKHLMISPDMSPILPEAGASNSLPMEHSPMDHGYF